MLRISVDLAPGGDGSINIIVALLTSATAFSCAARGGNTFLSPLRNLPAELLLFGRGSF